MEQWKAEMEERFGLLFVILDRTYLAQVVRAWLRVNPWRTHSRFIVSHNLLIDSTRTQCVSGSATCRRAAC